MRLAAKTGPADIGMSVCDTRVATQLKLGKQGKGHMDCGGGTSMTVKPGQHCLKLKWRRDCAN